ncbi:MAG: lamin tail domain-containing protein, partial [Anaerolineaceae bacterium]|nr:lamin tail domain-containing protein [Anaerolineaceae bacterium]
MARFNKIVFIFTLLVLIAGCTNTQKPAPPEATEVPLQTLDHVVISEVMTGIESNNNHDFIELFNPQNEVVNLAGYTLSYQLDQDSEITVLHEWDSHTLIPAYGHYLLGYSGEEFVTVVDTEFKQNLISNKGSLALFDEKGEIQDSLRWGKQPSNFQEGSPALSLSKGKSLERLPDGELGNATDTNDNLNDFALIAQPNPQNSGSPAVPVIAEQLQ